MDIALVEERGAQAPSCLVWGVFAAPARQPPRGHDKAAAAADPAPPPLPDMSPWLSAAALAAWARSQAFTGAGRQQLVIDLPAGPQRDGADRPASWTRLACVGLGPAAELDAAAWLHLGGQAVRLAKEARADSARIVLPRAAGGALPPPSDLERLLVGAHLGGYWDLRFRRPPPSPPPPLARLEVQASGPAGPRWRVTHRAAPARAAVVAQAVARARDLINEPAMTLTPAAFAKQAQAMARAAHLRCQVMQVPELERRGMALLLGVGMGSQNPPALVHLTYTPRGAGAGRPPVVLVGKGITFDAGGLCLKPPDGMMGMKVDMGGAAAVMAALGACSALAVDQPVHGILALAENMPSGSALRLGDILRHASGKTVEINNTDAEGRLVLADAIHYARALSPGCIIDLATLTGACMVALGPDTAGLFANREPLAERLQAAAAAAGEALWRMPLTPGLKGQLKSDLADMRNTGERYGGSITAALFLQEFVGDVPWAHLDIAGPVTSREAAGAQSRGGTGFGVATLLAFLSESPGARAKEAGPKSSDRTKHRGGRGVR